MSTLSTHDLRSVAEEYKRVKCQKSKWASGTRNKPSAKCRHDCFTNCETCHRAPLTAARHWSALNQHERAKTTQRNTTMARKVFRSDVVEAIDDNDVSDSSAGDDVADASAAPEPDAEIMYSFDAQTGPGRGSHILSHAINQAVERFENKETEKMVKEYDLVPDGKEELEFADAEDDFEVIDPAHFE